jgi:hypothetical protein
MPADADATSQGQGGNSAMSMAANEKANGAIIGGKRFTIMIL